jgi:hypothetical protein
LKEPSPPIASLNPETLLHPPVLSSQLRLLYLSGGISGDRGKNEPSRPLVFGERLAEVPDLILREFLAVFDLDDRRRDFSQARARKADNGNVLDLGMGLEEILYLDRVDILSSRYNGVFLYGVMKRSICPVYI